MPAGMTWARYLTFAASALGSMMLGASVVHNYYKPKMVSDSTILMCYIVYNRNWTEL